MIWCAERLQKALDSLPRGSSTRYPSRVAALFDGATSGENLYFPFEFSWILTIDIGKRLGGDKGCNNRNLDFLGWFPNCSAPRRFVLKCNKGCMVHVPSARDSGCPQFSTCSSPNKLCIYFTATGGEQEDMELTRPHLHKPPPTGTSNGFKAERKIDVKRNRSGIGCDVWWKSVSSMTGLTSMTLSFSFAVLIGNCLLFPRRLEIPFHGNSSAFINWYLKIFTTCFKYFSPMFYAHFHWTITPPGGSIL